MHQASVSSQVVSSFLWNGELNESKVNENFNRELREIIEHRMILELDMENTYHLRK